MFDVQERERSSLRARLGALVLFIALLAAPVADMAQILAQNLAQASPAAVTVEGNRRIEADAIRSYFRADAAGHVDANAADAALKALFDTGLFRDVRMRRVDGRLIVTVVENPVINRVAFEGNKSAKEDQLRTEVQSKAGGPLSRALVQADVVRITEVLRRSGRFNAHVEPKIIDLPNGRVDLVYEINEGERTGIKEIVFVGNKAFSSLRLKQIIKSGQTNLLSALLSNDIYDPDRIEAERTQLRRFYLTHGYADVRVVSAAVSYDPERKGFVVIFTIDEGALYRVGAVDVQSSIDGIEPASLRSKVRTAVGDIFNTEAADKSVEDISIELAKRGYPFAVVRPRV